ncbi:Tigger transposable element-derived protein 6 [Dictyocoela muelleri]|nr:Tigger transposable element-derived protein 6 [Dictyocoela muelleri]
MKLVDIYRVDNFKASNGWLQKFKLRHNIIIKFIKGESGLVDVELIESFKDIYEKKMKVYTPENIFNCDETGFFISVRSVEILLIRMKKTLVGNSTRTCYIIVLCKYGGRKPLSPTYR